MSWQLQTAAALIVALVAAHSVLGERFILIRLFRRDLPQLFGSDAFTKRTLRFAWHAFTLWGLALAALLILEPSRTVLLVVMTTMAATSILTVTVSRGQHLSWLVELVVVALLVWAL